MPHQHICNNTNEMSRKPHAIHRLSRQSHDDGQHDGIDQCGYRGLVGANELEAIHPFAQQEDDGDSGQKVRQYDAVDRPAEGIPI